MKKQLIVLLIALAVTLRFLGTVFAQPEPAKQVSDPQMTVPIYGSAYHPKFLLLEQGLL